MISNISLLVDLINIVALMCLLVFPSLCGVWVVLLMACAFTSPPYPSLPPSRLGFFFYQVGCSLFVHVIILLIRCGYFNERSESFAEAALAGSDAAALVALVKALPDDASVHEQVWERLYWSTNRLGSPAPAAGQDAAAAAGAIEALCDSLGRHAADAAVTQGACECLQRLVQCHAANQARAAAAGAPGLLAASRVTFAGNSTVLFRLHSALVCFRLTLDQRTCVLYMRSTYAFKHVHCQLT